MNYSRRTFVTTGLGLLSALALLPRQLVGDTGKPSALPADVDPKEDLAKAMGYTTDAKTVDVAKFPKRAGPEGAKQFCDNCALYVPKGPKGECAIFSKRLVVAKGWCNSWIKKA